MSMTYEERQTWLNEHCETWMFHINGRHQYYAFSINPNHVTNLHDMARDAMDELAVRIEQVTVLPVERYMSMINLYITVRLQDYEQGRGYTDTAKSLYDRLTTKIAGLHRVATALELATINE